MTDVTKENIYLQCAFLDPNEFRFLNANMEKRRVKNMWDLLENEILEFLDEEGNTKEENDGTRLELKGQLLKLQGEFNQSDRKETQLDVLKFWKTNQQKYSTMIAFVKMMLCNMPSSASSERTFKSSSMLYSED